MIKLAYFEFMSKYIFKHLTCKGKIKVTEFIKHVKLKMVTVIYVFSPNSKR